MLDYESITYVLNTSIGNLLHCTPNNVALSYVTGSEFDRSTIPKNCQQFCHIQNRKLYDYALMIINNSNKK